MPCQFYASVIKGTLKYHFLCIFAFHIAGLQSARHHTQIFLVLFLYTNCSISPLRLCILITSIWYIIHMYVLWFDLSWSKTISYHSLFFFFEIYNRSKQLCTLLMFFNFLIFLFLANFTHFLQSTDKWGLVCRKQVSSTRTDNYIPQILGDAITCPCPWYLFMENKCSNDDLTQTRQIKTNSVHI